MPTMTLSLPESMKAWVEAQAGRYGDAGDYLRELIRCDQERAEKIAQMQRLVTEGLESGAAEPFDFDAFLEEMREA